MSLPVFRALITAACCTPAVAHAQYTRDVDRLFRPRVSLQSPGCAVAAVKDGKKVVDRAYGLADLEHSVPNTPTTVFEAGSVSKQFTAAAILLLAQEGKLALSDDIRKHLPEIPDYGRVITIDHLLHHTSGMRDWRFLRAISGQKIGKHANSNADALDTASRQRGLNHAPGAEYAYTNTGYNLAAVIVERVSGRSLTAYTKDKIFVPLGMNSTQWRDDFRRVVRNRAVAYSPSGTTFEWDMPFENAYGSGGLLTTVGDLLLWNEALDKGRFGSKFTAELEDQGRLDSGEKISYARGLLIESYRGTREVSHGGITLGYVAFLARFPEHRVSVAVLCNGSSVNPNDIAHEIADHLLPQTLPAQQRPLSAQVRPAASSSPLSELWRPASSQLTEFVGSYRSDEAGATYLAQLMDGRLVLRLDGHPDETHGLAPTYRDTFVFAGGRIEFQRDGRGAVIGMSLTANRIRKLPFTRLR